MANNSDQGIQGGTIELKVDLTQLNIIKDDLINVSNHLSPLISNYSSIINGISDNWTGGDATDFLNNASSVATEMQNIKNYVDSLAEDINSAVNDYIQMR